MTEDNNETFENFDLAKALEFLNLFPFQKWNLQVKSIHPSEALIITLKRAERQITTGSNEWEQRLFMELIFLEALENHNIRMWQEKHVDAGESPYKGKVDFVFTPYQASFKLPYVVLSEAKKDNFEQGWGQCLMAIKASQIINKKDGYNFNIYGIVSNGKIWEFGKYTQNNEFLKTEAYTISQSEVILGILSEIFTDCERALV